ncbi:clostripain-related cysteine peptidase [Lachnoclostridium sp. Marseille-P6806]|uniref:clostripain-related cysteine peptidase n=1 Tax=Lachnoclostridium sp. Marseille-P6806 TaxID=2364793 RepID=UPI0010309C8A|nr:clostripain-related cysteine peptidase [Lachnoclostridium sp. Marseille-P6806]
MRKAQMTDIPGIVMFLLMMSLLLSSCGRSAGSLHEAPGAPSADAAVSSDGTAGAPSFTLLVYMIGSDLESEYGAASEDLMEMLAAPAPDLGANAAEETGEDEGGLHILIQTGGAKKWLSQGIAPEVQRYQVRDGKLELLETVGDRSMADAETLSDFITFSREKYPAERYGIILWNHGCGTLNGYGYDERYPQEMLSLSALRQAFSDGGVHFDFIGFDACLMGTLETAMAVSPYADYLIASEETEPGTGWSYTGILEALRENTGMETEALGRRIVNDFVRGEDVSIWDGNTLSVIRLAKIPALCGMLSDYLQEAAGDLDGGYPAYSHARGTIRGFGEGKFEQIDLIGCLEQMPGEPEKRDAVIEAVKSAVVYSDALEEGIHGLAFYFPYEQPERFEELTGMLRGLGFEESYFDFYTRFLNSMLVGQAAAGGGSALGADSPAQAFRTADWYDPEAAAAVEEEALLDAAVLRITKKDADYALDLPDRQWEYINDIRMDCYLDNGQGLIDMGTDVRYHIDYDGDIVFDYDGRWLALNGLNVPFYFEYERSESEGGHWYQYGYVPAMLGEEHILIMLCWDEDHPDGTVAGYRKSGEDMPEVPSKGLRTFKEGDELRFYYYFIDYENSAYQAYYINDEPLIYDGLLEVSYEPVTEQEATCYQGLAGYQVQFELTDIYRNRYDTESLWMGF